MSTQNFPHVEGAVGEREKALLHFHPFSLKQKLKHLVWVGFNHYVIRLPATGLWLRKEGIEMNHCLAYLHKDYAKAAASGEIELYSMIDREGKSVVTLEVARSWGFGIPVAVKEPTVLQIRGNANQCPPADIYLEDLRAFFLEYPQQREGKEWFVNPRLKNFDEKEDGRLFFFRIQTMLFRDQDRPRLPVPTFGRELFLVKGHKTKVHFAYSRKGLPICGGMARPPRWNYAGTLPDNEMCQRCLKTRGNLG